MLRWPHVVAWRDYMRRILEFLFVPALALCIAGCSGLSDIKHSGSGNVGGNGEYVNVNATESGQAKGYEVEATYNPLPNWTMKLTWAKQLTTISGAAFVGQAWTNYRLPTWSAATAPDLPTVYTLSSGQPMNLGSYWNGYGFDGTITGPGNPNGWTTAQNYYNIVEAAQISADQGVNGAAAPNQREYSWAYLTSYTVDRGPLKNVSLGGALRYEGRAIGGYYGNTGAENPLGQIVSPNTNLPIYIPAKYHVDLFLGYQFKMPWDDKIKCKLQLNVADLTSGGYLLPIAYNYDGTAAAYRIIAPRAYSLQAKFDF